MYWLLKTVLQWTLGYTCLFQFWIPQCVCPVGGWLCHQFSSVTQLYPTLCDPMNCSTPGLPIHHQLLEFTQTYVHRASDAIQPSHPLSSPSPPAPNPSQHQSFPLSQLFTWGGQSTGVSALRDPKKAMKNAARVPEAGGWVRDVEEANDGCRA